MSGKNIVELAANTDIDGSKAFEATFAPTTVHELMLEFDPKRSGPPVVLLAGAAGVSEEIRPIPLRGREGRYSGHTKGHDASWSTIRVTTARDVKARLVKVKLIGGAHPAVPPPA